MTTSAQARRLSDRRLNRSMWIIVSVLLAWLVVGFFRDPQASWQERGIVALFAFCFAVPVIFTRGYRKTLPALDRTPRKARPGTDGRIPGGAASSGQGDLPCWHAVSHRPT